MKSGNSYRTLKNLKINNSILNLGDRDEDRNRGTVIIATSS
jgi:hypothetical protein